MNSKTPNQITQCLAAAAIAERNCQPGIAQMYMKRVEHMIEIETLQLEEDIRRSQGNIEVEVDLSQLLNDDEDDIESIFDKITQSH